MIGSIAKLFRSLNDNSHPGEIAHAVSCGLMLGFLPKDNMMWYIIGLFFIFLRMNKGALLIFTLIGSLTTYFLDPLFHNIGFFILTSEEIVPYMTNFLNFPTMAYTKINNTIVMGSSIFSILIYIPMYVLSRFLITLWRTHVSSFFHNNRFVQSFLKLPVIDKIYAAYTKLESFNE